MHAVKIKVRRNIHLFQILELFNLSQLPVDISRIFDFYFNLPGDLGVDRFWTLSQRIDGTVIQLSPF